MCGKSEAFGTAIDTHKQAVEKGLERYGILILPHIPRTLNQPVDRSALTRGENNETKGKTDNRSRKEKKSKSITKGSRQSIESGSWQNILISSTMRYTC